VAGKPLVFNGIQQNDAVKAAEDATLYELRLVAGAKGKSLKEQHLNR
jgi:hypothetical protein